MEFTALEAGISGSGNTESIEMVCKIHTSVTYSKCLILLVWTNECGVFKEFNDKFHLSSFHLSLKDASCTDHKPLQGKVMLPTFSLEMRLQDANLSQCVQLLEKPPAPCLQIC